MVTINDKISLIMDINQLFDIRDKEVESMINGDTYKINELYTKALIIFEKNRDRYQFTHTASGETQSLANWMDDFQFTNDPISIITFVRYAIIALKRNV